MKTGMASRPAVPERQAGGLPRRQPSVVASQTYPLRFHQRVVKILCHQLNGNIGVHVQSSLGVGAIRMERLPASGRSACVVRGRAPCIAAGPGGIFGGCPGCPGRRTSASSSRRRAGSDSPCSRSNALSRQAFTPTTSTRPNASIATCSACRTAAKEAGRHVFFQVGDRGMLLIFRPEATLRGDRLPAHGARGPGHFALGIAAEDLEAWRLRLREHRVEIEHEQTWPHGGHSLYFRDPAGNSVELITPGRLGTALGLVIGTGFGDSPSRVSYQPHCILSGSRASGSASLDDGRLRMHRLVGGQADWSTRGARSGSTT